MMDSRSSETSSNLDYDNSSVVLLVATSDRAADLARPAIEASGHRTARIPVEGAAARIREQPGGCAVWVEVDGTPDPSLDAFLEEMGAIDSNRRWPTIISASRDMIDPVFARILEPSLEMLAEPSPADRMAALGLALAQARLEAKVGDIAGEASATRLKQLSDEVGRIAATLARLSTGPEAPATAELPTPATASGLPTVAGDTVRQVIRARRLRSRFFDEELFADPAWDMLLDLFQAEIAQHRVPVSSLCIAASVPATTALRWLKTMTDQGIFQRRADPHDGRRVFVELSPSASEAMRRYFGEVGKVAVI